MRKFPFVLASFFLLTVPRLHARNCTHTASTLKCLKYVDNYDGDTLTLTIPGTLAFFGHDARVRIMGIDTPEIKGKTACERRLAQQAKAFLHRLMTKAKDIELRNIKKEKYFRIVGDLFADGVLVSNKLLGAKLAVAYDGGHKKAIDWCKIK